MLSPKRRLPVARGERALVRLVLHAEQHVAQPCLRVDSVRLAGLHHVEQDGRGQLVKSVAACDFIERRENVILIGQPGTGKTLLAIALGHQAREKGFAVRFVTVQELAARLRGAHADHSVEETIEQCLKPDLVILDELGFTPLDRLLADALYRIIASRYERGNIVVTSKRASSCGPRSSRIP